MEAELYHHGILGQKWGVRRFQNFDGSLTSLGFNHRNIREFRLDANKLKSSAKDFISSTSNTLEGVKGKSFDDLKIDALDYMNRKGVLDIFNANADAPFKAIRECEKYQSSSSKNVLKALENTERYLGYRQDTDKTTLTQDRIHDEHSYRKMLDHYTKMDKNRGYKGLVEGLLSDSKTALSDKKLGMLSKDARDIERQTMGAEFAKNLSSKSISELSKKWYNTKEDGRHEEFKGKVQEITYETKKVPAHYKTEDVVEKTGFYEWHDPHQKVYQTKQMKEAGINGMWIDTPNWDRLRAEAGVPGFENKSVRAQPEKAWYPFNDEGYIEKPRYAYSNGTRTVQKQVYVPEHEEKVVTGVKATKEYLDWMDRQAKANKMPSDYSHLTSEYKPTIDLGKDWMNQMYHSDLTEDFLMHHGIMGMHWGERKYQNKDGSLTEEGRKHYGVGPAREFAKKVGATAKKASETISTAARKTFRPTEADMNEKLAKAYEKKRIQDKKDQLRELQGKKKKIKDMSSQEVWEEIQARNNQRTLERMRRDASALHKGTDFIAKTAGLATTPVRELAGFGLNLAKENVAYGINRAARSAIDDAVFSASKKRRLENRTELEKLRDDSETNKLKFEESTRGLREQNEIQRMKNNAALGDLRTAHEAKKLRNEMDDFDSKMSLREMNNARERTKAERDAAVNFLERQVAMGSESASTYAAERLARMKKNSPGGGGGQNPNQQSKKDKKKNKYKNYNNYNN